MKQALINKLLNSLDDDDLSNIAEEFSSINADDFEFENRKSTLKYISQFTKSTHLTDSFDQTTFVECIGQLIGFSKAADQFNLISKELELQTGITTYLGFDMEFCEHTIYPTYAMLCELFSNE